MAKGIVNFLEDISPEGSEFRGIFRKKIILFYFFFAGQENFCNKYEFHLPNWLFCDIIFSHFCFKINCKL